MSYIIENIYFFIFKMPLGYDAYVHIDMRAWID